MSSGARRVLITGLSTYWGGRLAQALERDPGIETIIGIDRRPPKLALERTEFVEVADAHSLIRRIVDAAEIDTVVDTRLVLDPLITTPKRAHENNVIGTMNILTACSGPDSPVRKLVVRSSTRYYGVHQDDPAFFTEEMRRPHPPKNLLDKDVCEVEDALRTFRDRHPEKIVTVLRFATEIGPDVRSAWQRYLSAPVIPTILGFDPRIQFIHEDDMAHCLEHAVRFDLDGIYNCAADGVLALSEVAGLLGTPTAPVLPPVGTEAAMALMQRAGVPVHPDLERTLRFGKAVDNRRYKATGFRFTHTTRETLLALRKHLKLAPLQPADGSGSYRYEKAVEEFLRFSPNVRRRPKELEDVAAGSGPGWESLTVKEIVGLLPSLSDDDLFALRDHEVAGPARAGVLKAIDRVTAQRVTQ
ncbi:MAG: NAD-dependent epimerase/dehydratase family protein [Baekduia sp.]